jgi:hypothetical protein
MPAFAVPEIESPSIFALKLTERAIGRVMLTFHVAVSPSILPS